VDLVAVRIADAEFDELSRTTWSRPTSTGSPYPKSRNCTAARSTTSFSASAKTTRLGLRFTCA
jgi:hypothetical protein